MHIVYSDERSEGGGIGGYEKWNANAGYVRHYKNYLYLDFIAQHSGNRQEREQARKEITICERKMAWWRRHPNFEQGVVAQMCLDAKREWAK